MADELELCARCGVHVHKGTTCPKSIGCPVCKASPNAPCKRPSGHRAAEMHAPRYEAAERQDWDAGVRYPGQLHPATGHPAVLPGQLPIPDLPDFVKEAHDAAERDRSPSD